MELFVSYELRPGNVGSKNIFGNKSVRMKPSRKPIPSSGQDVSNTTVRKYYDRPN